MKYACDAGRVVVISVDLDEWYHSRWITGSPVARWPDTPVFFQAYYGSDRPQGELNGPARRVLDLLDRCGIKATFFVLGEVAGFYPDLVREVHRRGHEIACHGQEHVDLFLLSRQRFTEGVRRAKQTLEDLIGEPVLGYRAPNLIIEPWVIPVLEELGFAYDSSVCPSRALFGKFAGVSAAPQNPYRMAPNSLTRAGDGPFLELPIPTFPVLKLPAATGIATRVFGTWWTRAALEAALRHGPASYYFHPYEIDGVPAGVGGRNWRARLFLQRHTGDWMERSLTRLFTRLKAQFIPARKLVAAVQSSEEPTHASRVA